MGTHDSHKNNDTHGKVIDLAIRIKEAKGESPQSSEGISDEKESEATTKESRAGTEFLSSVIGGGILGYATDWLLGTLPWGLLFFLIMGFISAVYRANAAMRDE